MWAYAYNHIYFVEETKVHTDFDILTEARASLARVIAMIDGMLAGGAPPEAGITNYRRRPGGPLNEAGEAEMIRRFEAGESDSTIALAMQVSLVGTAKRRAMWRRMRGGRS